jgi:hypothetical protein
MPPRKKVVEPADRDRLELSAIERMRIISLPEAARLRGCSEDTLRREIAAGRGPKVYTISPNRVGVRLGEALEFKPAHSA